MSSPLYVRVRTKECPRCGKVETLNMTRAEFNAFKEDEGPIQETLKRFSPEVRERFLSGYCPECWNIVFPPEDDDL